MKLLCLGTGGYHPNERRHTACYYLPHQGIVLDAGSGMFRLFSHLQSQPGKTLDIFLTHAHLDHIIGLTYLLQLNGSDLERVTVHAEDAKIEAIKTHLFSELLFPILPAIEFRPLAGPIDLESCQVSWFGLRHPGGSAGFRIAGNGRSMAYVTDTTADTQAPYVDHIQDVDLLAHECYFGDDQTENAELMGHSCVSSVADVANACKTKRLLLVHINPWTNDEESLLETAKRSFTESHLATDQMQLDV